MGTNICINIVRVHPVTTNAMCKIDACVMKSDHGFGRNVDISLLVVIRHRLAIEQSIVVPIRPIAVSILNRTSVLSPV